MQHSLKSRHNPSSIQALKMSKDTRLPVNTPRYTVTSQHKAAHKAAYMRANV